jgi:hypothetical protein
LENFLVGKPTKVFPKKKSLRFLVPHPSILINVFFFPPNFVMAIN